MSHPHIQYPLNKSHLNKSHLPHNVQQAHLPHSARQSPPDLKVDCLCRHLDNHDLSLPLQRPGAVVVPGTLESYA